MFLARFRRIALLFFLLNLVVSIAPTVVEAKSNWIELIVQGKNKAAADELSKMVSELNPNTDETITKLLRSTVRSISKGCQECAESEKIILFRGTELGRSDQNFGTNQRPFFVSRLLRDKRFTLKPQAIAKMPKKTDIYQLLRDHGRYGRAPRSPLISTSYSSWVANNGQTVLVLKMCPRRVIYNFMSSFTNEFEMVIPFFIHPNEVLAIIKPNGGGVLEDGITKGSFDIIMNGLKNRSDSELKKMVVQQARANARFLDVSAYTFGKRLEKKLRSRCASLLTF